MMRPRCEHQCAEKIRGGRLPKPEMRLVGMFSSWGLTPATSAIERHRRLTSSRRINFELRRPIVYSDKSTQRIDAEQPPDR